MVALGAISFWLIVDEAFDGGFAMSWRGDFADPATDSEREVHRLSDFIVVGRLLVLSRERE